MALRSRELPVGTVTMLFSDIEGSTALLLRLGDRYAEALSAQRTLLRDAFDAGGGHELGTEGDSFFVVFESARSAVSSCVAAQRALAGYDWPSGGAVRVRMGLHSGEPARHEDGYVGLAVHRAARIASTAHGGQVVLSDVTRQLVSEPRLPADVSLHDLGWHRLKDIEEPEHIFQLVAAGLEAHFPALRSLGAETSLPVPMTPLVGRDRDLDLLRDSLLQRGVRLVTLTGTGGVGKSRLALAAASLWRESFPDGVFFFPLAAVIAADGMWKTIAEGLGVGDDESAADAVIEHLKGRQALLVLDNLEQVKGAAEVVSTLLLAGPGLAIVGTSRRPLRLQGEHEQLVAPLDIPSEVSVDAVTASGAAQLFVQQADMVKPGFAITPHNAADIAAVCRRLDGIPLAIELAASRARLLAPRALLARLGRTLGLASGDVGRPSRQQTLRSAIAWSCDLLTPDLETAFRRAGVFAGGCDLDAFAVVACADLVSGTGLDSLQPLADLLDVSLVTVTEEIDGEPRVRMLETIREYAIERLEASGDLDSTRRRHAEFYAAFAEQAYEQLTGPTQLAAIDRLEAEQDNMRAALGWSLERPVADPGPDDGRAVIGMRLVSALAPFWYQHGHVTEGRQWLERAVALISGDAGAPLGRLAHWLGVLLQQQGQSEMALPFFQRSLAIWRDLDDRDQTARVLNSLGIFHAQLGDEATARCFLEESIAVARDLGSDARLATALSSLGTAETFAGNVESAIELLQEALALDQARGNLMGVAIGQQALAMANLRAGRSEEAQDLLSATIDFVIRSGDVAFLADTLELSAAIAADRGDARPAARLMGASEGVRQRAGVPMPVSDVALMERLLAPARAMIAADVWEAEWAAGQALDHQQVLALTQSYGPQDR